MSCWTKYSLPTPSKAGKGRPAGFAFVGTLARRLLNGSPPIHGLEPGSLDNLIYDWLAICLAN